MAKRYQSLSGKNYLVLVHAEPWCLPMSSRALSEYFSHAISYTSIQRWRKAHNWQGKEDDGSATSFEPDWHPLCDSALAAFLPLREDSLSSYAVMIENWPPELKPVVGQIVWTMMSAPDARTGLKALDTLIAKLKLDKDTLDGAIHMLMTLGDTLAILRHHRALPHAVSHRGFDPEYHAAAVESGRDTRIILLEA